MILFVFEGKNREPSLFKTLEYLFLGNNENVIFSYNNNIYNLYKEITKSDFNEDIFYILKNKPQNESLRNIKSRSEISQIFLFFDYDNHNNKNQEVSNSKINEMLAFFNDETSDFGKLYINYPMVESIYYTKEKLLDNNYYSYTVELSQSKDFKRIVNKESFYKNLDFIVFKINKKNYSISVDDISKRKDIVRQNWLSLIKMNTKKANYLINDKNEFPKTTEMISQKNIFEMQKKKYFAKSKISILNSFPLFVFEYRGNILFIDK